MPRGEEMLAYFLALVLIGGLVSIEPTDVQAVQIAALVIAPLFLVAWWVSSGRQDRASRMVQAATCEHCRYSLEGLAAPWTCPECGRAAQGVTRRVFEPAKPMLEWMVQSMGMALIGAACLSPLLSREGLEAAATLLFRLRAHRLLGPNLMWRNDAAGWPTLLAFVGLYSILRSLAPFVTIRRACFVTVGVMVFFAGATILSLMLEWRRGSSVLWPYEIAGRAAVWACATAVLIDRVRVRARAAKRAITDAAASLTTAPSPVPTPPETASPSPPATTESPAPAPPP